ncbi:hypothetical protein JXO52_09825 [bacterium]|nr:hypothetical protein [bacterium]
MHHMPIHRHAVRALILACAASAVHTAAIAQSGTGTQGTGSHPAVPVYSGYFQPGFTLDSDGSGGFFLKRARFSATAAFSGPVSWKVQAELAGQPKLLDAILRVRFLPGLTLSAGQFKIPVSRENLLSSGKLITISRSRIVEALTARSGDPLGNQNGRDIGIAFEGAITGRQRTLIEYTLAVINGSGINRTDVDRWKDVAARIAVTPWRNVTLAVSALCGRHRYSGIDGTGRSRTGADIAWTPGPFLFIAEYLQGLDGRVETSGWYLLARFPLSGDRLDGVCTYDRFTTNDPLQDKTSDTVTIGLDYRVNPHTCVMVNHTLTGRDVHKRICGATLVMLQTGF